MPYCANSVLQDTVTKTTAFQGTGRDIGSAGAPNGELKLRFSISNYSAATAGAVWTPVVEHSDDNTAWLTLVTGTPRTCGTAAATALEHLVVGTRKRYVRMSVTLSPTTGTPTITYRADLGIAAP